MRAVIIPGFGGSGEAHWQTIWQRDEGDFLRISPASWTSPELDDWIAALDRAIAACGSPPILVAHSLGCLLVAFWVAKRGGAGVRGAFLVAVPDPESPGFPAAAEFRDPPWAPMPFPTLIVASLDDPLSSTGRVVDVAAQCHARIAIMGDLGHINSDSGHGRWPEGLRLLVDFERDELAKRGSPPAARPTTKTLDA